MRQNLHFPFTNEHNNKSIKPMKIIYNTVQIYNVHGSTDEYTKANKIMTLTGNIQFNF